MSPPAVAERPRALTGSPHRSGRAGADGSPLERSGGGRLTLEQRLDRVWEGLHADGAADCPVCHGRMGAVASGSAARCGGCGSTLA